MKRPKHPYTTPHFKELCYTCVHQDFDARDLSRMGFCKISKHPEWAMKAKHSCSEYVLDKDGVWEQPFRFYSKSKYKEEDLK